MLLGWGTRADSWWSKRYEIDIWPANGAGRRKATQGHVAPVTTPNARDQIIAAGMQTVLRKGYNGSGIQDITASAGLPKAAFYSYFESKEALGAELVRQYGESGPRRFGLTDKSIPPLERLRRHFEATSDFYIGMRYELGCLLGNFSAELANQSPLIRARLAALFSDWTHDIESAISEAQRTAAISTSAHAGRLAIFLLDSYEGAILRARVEKSRQAFDAFIRVVFTQILV
jgi:TetR/AcrR family transcriptional repressor of nem operon